MTVKPAEHLKNSGHAVNNDTPFSICGRQHEKPELEEEIWDLLGELETAPDEEAQGAVREKIWRLAGKQGVE